MKIEVGTNNHRDSDPGVDVDKDGRVRVLPFISKLAGKFLFESVSCSCLGRQRIEPTSDLAREE
jgi:hypothetical protein